MNDEIKITKESFLKAYDEGCDDVKATLKRLCPDAIKEKREFVKLESADVAKQDDGWFCVTAVMVGSGGKKYYVSIGPSGIRPCNAQINIEISEDGNYWRITEKPEKNDRD